MRKRSIKNTRINEEVRKELSSIIRDDVKDPRISPFVSIVSCEVAPDLKTAKVYVSVLGNADDLSETMKGLKNSAGYIRRQLAQNMNMRNTPELNFIGDASIAYGVEMSKKIDEVIKHDEENAVREENDEPDRA